MKHYLARKVLIVNLILIAIVVLVRFFSLQVLARESISPPTFLSCQDKIFTSDGDWASYDDGNHGIPGVGNLQGSDDVYSLSSGNFLQCFCPVEGDKGIQTNWWNIERVGLTEEQINELTSGGWIYESTGAGWNLFDERYLAKNEAFVCSEPTPTPTLTPTPTTTPTPSLTPTPHPGPESRCVSLSASPTEGTAPLTVRFNGSGFDEDGDIQRYKFDFGDSSGGQPQIWEQDGSEAFHRYEFPGTYVAALHVKDSRGNWRNGQNDCKKTITVQGKPQVLAAVLPTQLPITGAGTLGILGLVPVGYYLYKRFKLL